MNTKPKNIKQRNSCHNKSNNVDGPESDILLPHPPHAPPPPPEKDEVGKEDEEGRGGVVPLYHFVLSLL